MRIVVAAFGNELRGDDGFGIAVLRHLERLGAGENRPNGTRLLEVGTGGLWLAQELITPCDRLIIIDAVSRGTVPGTLYVLKVDGVTAAPDVDMHLAVPSRVLGVAKAMGTLPRETFLVGCEPAETDELSLELTPDVRDAVEPAARHVLALMEAE